MRPCCPRMAASARLSSAFLISTPSTTATTSGSAATRRVWPQSAAAAASGFFLAVSAPMRNSAAKNKQMRMRVRGPLDFMERARTLARRFAVGQRHFPARKAQRRVLQDALQPSRTRGASSSRRRISPIGDCHFHDRHRFVGRTEPTAPDVAGRRTRAVARLASAVALGIRSDAACSAGSVRVAVAGPGIGEFRFRVGQSNIGGQRQFAVAASGAGGRSRRPGHSH